MNTHQSVEKTARPTGIWLSLLTFPFGAVFCSATVLGLWSLFRELYCRAYRESLAQNSVARVLCIYIDWEFRPDLVPLLVGSFIFYAPIHFWWLRHLPRRTHFATLLSLGLLWLLTSALKALVPGKWESWY